MSRLPCVSCDEPLRLDASNCPYCGQRQLTRGTAVSYITAGLPVAVFGTVGVLQVAAPGLVGSTLGFEGLLLVGAVVYTTSSLVLWHAYRRRRALAGDSLHEGRATD